MSNVPAPDGLDEVLNDWRRNDFIRLSPGMIASCGGDLVVAILMARLLYRTFDGTQGWSATAGEMAADTGLSVLQVRRGLKVLRDDRGWITARRGDQWNPTLTYFIADGSASQDALRDTPPGTSRVPPPEVSHGAPPDASLPYMKEEEQEEHQEPARAGGELILFNQRLPKLGNTALLTDGFEEFWSMAVRKTSKASARKAYLKACGKVGRAALMDSWAAFNAVWGRWPADRRQYIPHPSTWLNDERWEDSLPDEPAAESWGAFAERVQVAADDWYAAQDVPSPTYSVEQITATVVSETSGWG